MVIPLPSTLLTIVHTALENFRRRFFAISHRAVMSEMLRYRAATHSALFEKYNDANYDFGAFEENGAMALVLKRLVRPDGTAIRHSRNRY
jgi:hypothetical protein